MTENKDVKQGSVLSPFPLLAAANLLFILPLIHIGHRSSIRVAVFGQHRLSRSSECQRSCVVWTQLEHAGSGGICPILQNDYSHSDQLSVLDDRGELLRDRDPVRGAAGRNRRGAPADQHRLSCHAQAWQVPASGRVALRRSPSCDHEHRHRSSYS